jgi:hypothetical protein
MSCFAIIGPRSGPILGRHRLVAVGVLQASDEVLVVLDVSNGGLI